MRAIYPFSAPTKTLPPNSNRCVAASKPSWMRLKRNSIDQTRDSRRTYDQGRTALRATASRRAGQHPGADEDKGSDKAGGNGQATLRDWTDAAWRSWTPPTKFPALVRFGQMRVDLPADRRQQQRRHGKATLELPAPFIVPGAAGVSARQRRCSCSTIAPAARAPCASCKR